MDYPREDYKYPELEPDQIPDEEEMYQLLYSSLINSFQALPTTIQDTLLRIISIRLRELYAQIQRIPEELLQPSRYDMLKAKAAQVAWDIDNKHSLLEQKDLLESIFEIYKKRGSIESIENMWLYYGRDLPKDVNVSIPLYNIFRYSISKWSGKDKFQDGVHYRAGVFTITIKDDYDLDQVRDLVMTELVTAGRKVNFLKEIWLSTLDGYIDFSADEVKTDYLIDIQMLTALQKFGLIWSEQSVSRTWSGKANILIDIARLMYIDLVQYIYHPISDIDARLLRDAIARYFSENAWTDHLVSIKPQVKFESDDPAQYYIRYYDKDGNMLEPAAYGGYFILSESKLGTMPIIYYDN